MDTLSAALLIFGLILRQVFDDVAVELAMAILQFFQSSPNEDQIFRTLKALARFLEVLTHILIAFLATAVNSCVISHHLGISGRTDDYSNDWTASKTICWQKRARRRADKDN